MFKPEQSNRTSLCFIVCREKKLIIFLTFNLYSCLINVLKLLYIIDDWLIKIWKPMSKRYFNMLKNRLRWLPLDESFFSSALMYAVILDVYSWLYMLEIRERIYIVSVFQTKSCRIWHSNKIYTPQKCRYKEVIVSNFTSYKYIKVVPKWVLKKNVVTEPLLRRSVDCDMGLTWRRISLGRQ